MNRLLGLLIILAIFTGCTTAQQIRSPNGDMEYVIGCGAILGWNVCYNRANDVCPDGYTTLSEDQGFNRKELRIICPKAQPRDK
jgi:hypothetical protein